MSKSLLCINIKTLHSPTPKSMQIYNAQRARVFLILALVNRPASSVAVSGTGGALSFTEGGTESISITFSIVELDVLLLSTVTCFSVVFCSFKTAGAGSALESTEGSAVSAASSSCSLEDVLESGEDCSSSWGCGVASVRLVDGVLGFWTLISFCGGYKIQKSKIR